MLKNILGGLKMEKQEFSLKKATTSFAVRFVIFSIIFMVIGTIIALVMWASSIDTNSNDYEEIFDSINGLAWKLVIVDVIVALLSTLIATKGSTKKFKITEENSKLLKRNVAIVLVVVAIIIFAVHMIIVNTINSMALEDSGAESLSEIIEEADDYVSDFGYAADEVDELNDMLKSLQTSERIYEFSAIIYLVMIPVSFVLIKKKIEE